MASPRPNQWDNQKAFQNQMNDPFYNNQKLVIALCRKPLSADEDDFENMKG